MSKSSTQQRPVLQRSRRDLVLTAVFTTVAVLAVLLVWIIAPIRQTHFEAVESSVTEPPLVNFVPDQATEIWSGSADFMQTKPVTFHGQVLTTDGDQVIARNASGNTTWTYDRPDELCTAMSSWGDATLVYKSGRGCGEVVTINGSEPNYEATRAAHASEAVVPVSSLDRTGIAASDRMELWREDMVRTVEYGDVPAPHEQDQQPNPGCTLDSALTRKSKLAVVERCDDTYWLRIMETTPEDAREPEITAEVELGSHPAHVIAIGQQRVKVLLEDDPVRMVTYDLDGSEYQEEEVADFDHDFVWNDAANLFYAPTADLPHHITFYDGKRLYLFDPVSLETKAELDDAIGTGVAVDDEILYPTAAGWRVYNWADDTAGDEIEIQRDNATDHISLGIIGTTVLELRGTALHAFTIAAGEGSDAT